MENTLLTSTFIKNIERLQGDASLGSPIVLLYAAITNVAYTQRQYLHYLFHTLVFHVISKRFKTRWADRKFDHGSGESRSKSFFSRFTTPYFWGLHLLTTPACPEASAP